MNQLSNELNCQHGWRKASGSWLPCPACKTEETAALQGAPVTPEQHAAVAAKGAAMRNGALELDVRNPRTLALEGKTLAGCKVGKMAANATSNTRFHVEAACGHRAIIAGTDLKQAEKAGRVVKCPPCTRADGKAKRAQKREARP